VRGRAGPTGVTTFICTDPTSTGLLGIETVAAASVALTTMQCPSDFHLDPFPPSMATVNESNKKTKPDAQRSLLCCSYTSA
jgi:hypothetical protein